MPRSVLCLPKKSHTHQTNVWPNFFVNIVLISIKEFIFDTHNCSRSTNQSTKAIQCSCSMLFNTESDRLSGIVTLPRLKPRTLMQSTYVWFDTMLVSCVKRTKVNQFMSEIVFVPLSLKMTFRMRNIFS